ncbi:MAG: NUDIX domain-containing protein [Haloglomus sp.]
MYERYGPADWDTFPSDPDEPATDPDPADVRVRATVKCLVVRDGRACCIRWPSGDWSLPGGGIEPDESLHAAAAREAAEEVGLDVRAAAVLDCYSYFRTVNDGVRRTTVAVVRCVETERRPVDTTGDPSEVEAITDHEWVPLAAVGDRVLGRALPAILTRHVDGA